MSTSHKVLTIVAFLGAAAAGAAITALQVQPSVPQGVEIGGRTPAELFNYFVALVGGGGGLAALLKVLWPQGAGVIDTVKKRLDDGYEVTQFPTPVKPKWLRIAEAVQQLRSDLADSPDAKEPLKVLWAMAPEAQDATVSYGQGQFPNHFASMVSGKEK